MTGEPRVTVDDCRTSRFCLRGVRSHCSALGLDFRRLVREGLPVSELDGIDDELVRQCVRNARARCGVPDG